MGLVTSSLTTGRNALLSYQGALTVVGNNVANAGNSDYTRQSSQLAAVIGTKIGQGLQPGAGVNLTSLHRHVDEALENRLRASTGDLRSAQAESSVLSQLESYFADLSGTGISSQMIDFFNSLSDVQNAPDDTAIRAVAVSTGDSLARSIQSARGDILEIAENVNTDIKNVVSEADRIASEIARLNTEIVSVEAGGKGQANALRDQRDALLRDLSEYFDTEVKEQPDGSINVYVGSEPLIQHGLSRGLATVDDLDGESIRTAVVFADTNARISVAGGEIEGMVRARDEQVLGTLDTLDQLALAVITEVNSVHADGQGLSPLRSVVSTNVIDDPTAPLNSVAANLGITPENGSFYITVSDDATGTPVAYRIEVDLDGQGTDTSLNDIIAAINTQVNGVTAALTVDQRLSLTADAGFSFSFGHDGQQFRADSSKTLAALGINTFFEGSSAADIAVRPELLNDSGMLAAATVNHVGGGINAGRLAGIIDGVSETANNSSLLDFYNSISNGIATAGGMAKDNAAAAEVINQSLTAQRESVSGVSLDEEAIEMLRYERAFQGAARYITTVDNLMQEMLSLVR